MDPPTHSAGAEGTKAEPEAMIELPSQSFSVSAAATEIEPTPCYGVGIKGAYATGSMLVGYLLWKMAVVTMSEYSDTVV